MAERQPAGRFMRFLSRIRSTRLLNDEDAGRVSHLAVNKRGRRELKVNRSDLDAGTAAFLKTFPRFPNADLGLESMGWRMIWGGPAIEPGAFADIKLAYKITETSVPLESRHIVFCKVQPMGGATVVWNEVNILRSCVHENIIDFFGLFGDQKWNTIWILMEYATAGDLFKELKRYDGEELEEENSRFYAKQILSGLSYLHSKEIVHNDLHPGNVVLKYNRDGSKTCMLCDFGCSTVFNPVQQRDETRFKKDLRQVRSLISIMTYKRTREVFHVIDDHDFPVRSVQELLTFPWFAGPAVPPFPKSPTPLLKPEVVRRLGFQPQAHKTGAEPSPPLRQESQGSSSSPEEIERSSFIQRTRRAIRNIPQQIRSRVSSRGSGHAGRTGASSEAVAVPETIHESPVAPSRPRAVFWSPTSGHRTASPIPIDPPARAPRRQESQPQAEASGFQSFGRYTPPPEEESSGRQSLGNQMRTRMRSLGQAIRRPFRRSSRDPDQ